jgi:hypothetical protein
VQLLLTAPELQKALIYKCTESLSGNPPDYFCIYEFSDNADYLAFELGEHKAIATKITNAATGRDSIEILQRTQYTRWLNNQWPRIEPYKNYWRLAVCVTSSCDWTLEEKRWLADRFQMLRAETPLVSAQVFAQNNKTSEVFLALDFDGSNPKQVWQLARELLTQNSNFGRMPTLTTQWAVSASLLQISCM